MSEKKPIKLDLSDVCSSLDDIEPLIIKRSKQAATEYERKLLEFATLHRVICVYVFTESKTEVKDGKHIYSVVNKFSIRMPKGKECICHDFTRLITMDDYEFEFTSSNEKNYEIAKMYREAMRSTPSVEKLLRQRRKQNDVLFITEGKQMPNNVAEYKSLKSNSTYTVTTENGRAFLGVTGEAATNPKVIAEKERIRKSGGDEVELVKWIARKLANTY